MVIYNRLQEVRICKKVLSVFFAVMLVVGLSGCGNKPDVNGSMKSDDGRSYGGVIEGEQGQIIHTAFFDISVDSAKKYTTYQFDDGLYQADQDMAYLEVVVTISNTYDKDIPMSISDFTLDFSGNESSDIITGFGKAEINKDTFMDNIYTLKKGDSITKTILYTVPDRAEYLLCYKEYYEDEFEGDSYEITFTPESMGQGMQDSGSQDNAVQSSETTGDGSENTESQDSETQESEAQESESQESETQESESQESETQDNEAQTDE